MPQVTIIIDDQPEDQESAITADVFTNAPEDQDSLAYAIACQMIGELQGLLNAFYSLTPNYHQKSNEPPTTH